MRKFISLKNILILLFFGTIMGLHQEAKATCATGTSTCLSLTDRRLQDCCLRDRTLVQCANDYHMPTTSQAQACDISHTHFNYGSVGSSGSLGYFIDGAGSCCDFEGTGPATNLNRHIDSCIPEVCRAIPACFNQSNAWRVDLSDTSLGTASLERSYRNYVCSCLNGDLTQIDPALRWPSGLGPTPNCGNSDVSVIKSIDRTSARVGEHVRYTISVSNVGMLDSTGVEVEDTFDSRLTGLAFVGTPLTGCSLIPGSPVRLLCTGMPTLVRGTSYPNIVIDAVVGTNACPALSPIENTVYATAVGDLDHTGNNVGRSEPLNVTCPTVANLSVTKTVTPSSGIVIPGQRISYDIVITNSGDLPADLVSVSDTLPNEYDSTVLNPSVSGCTITSTSARPKILTCDGLRIPGMIAGVPGSLSIHIDAIVSAISHTPASEGACTRIIPRNDVVVQWGSTTYPGQSDIVSVQCSNPEVFKGVFSGALAAIGYESDFIVSVRNNSSSASNPVVLRDALPSNLTYSSYEIVTPGSMTCRVEFNGVTCQVPSIPRSSTLALHVRGRITAMSCPSVNSASIYPAGTTFPLGFATQPSIGGPVTASVSAPSSDCSPVATGGMSGSGGMAAGGSGGMIATAGTGGTIMPDPCASLPAGAAQKCCSNHPETQLYPAAQDCCLAHYSDGSYDAACSAHVECSESTWQTVCPLGAGGAGGGTVVPNECREGEVRAGDVCLSKTLSSHDATTASFKIRIREIRDSISEDPATAVILDDIGTNLTVMSANIDDRTSITFPYTFTLHRHDDITIRVETRLAPSTTCKFFNRASLYNPKTGETLSTPDISVPLTTAEEAVLCNAGTAGTGGAMGAAGTGGSIEPLACPEGYVLINPKSVCLKKSNGERTGRSIAYKIDVFNPTTTDRPLELTDFPDHVSIDSFEDVTGAPAVTITPVPLETSPYHFTIASGAFMHFVAHGTIDTTDTCKSGNRAHLKDLSGGYEGDSSSLSITLTATECSNGTAGTGGTPACINHVDCGGTECKPMECNAGSCRELPIPESCLSSGGSGGNASGGSGGSGGDASGGSGGTSTGGSGGMATGGSGGSGTAGTGGSPPIPPHDVCEGLTGLDGSCCRAITALSTTAPSLIPGILRDPMVCPTRDVASCADFVRSLSTITLGCQSQLNICCQIIINNGGTITDSGVQNCTNSIVNNTLACSTVDDHSTHDDHSDHSTHTTTGGGGTTVIVVGSGGAGGTGGAPVGTGGMSGSGGTTPTPSLITQDATCTVNAVNSSDIIEASPSRQTVYALAQNGTCLPLRVTYVPSLAGSQSSIRVPYRVSYIQRSGMAVYRPTDMAPAVSPSITTPQSIGFLDADATTMDASITICGPIDYEHSENQIDFTVQAIAADGSVLNSTSCGINAAAEAMGGDGSGCRGCSINASHKTKRDYGLNMLIMIGFSSLAWMVMKRRLCK